MSDTPTDPTPPEDPPNSETPSDELVFGPSDEQLKRELKDYAKALREEFAREEETSTTGITDPTSNAEKYTRQFFRQNLPDAAAQIVWLSCNSTSDSVRLRACQIIIKEALEDARAEGDPIKDLLSDLRNAPTAITKNTD